MNQENVVQNTSDGYRLSFNYRADTVRISKSTMVVLGNPKYIQFLINLEKKQLFIHGTNTREQNCIEVPGKDPRNRCNYVLYGLSCIRKISNIAGWDLEGVFTLTGIYLSEFNIVRFDLLSAERRQSEFKTED